jgi:rRNA processing protein Krr1/Pno1
MRTLLSDVDAKNAYDRLAAGSFAKHDCTTYAQRAKDSQKNTFADQARKLITRGFKPKDAVDITLQEMMFEHRGDPKFIEKAQIEAEDFIRRVKEGLI